MQEKYIFLFFILLALLVFPVATPSAAILFQDDFNDGNADGWDAVIVNDGTLPPSPPTYGVVDNILRLSIVDNNDDITLKYTGGLTLPDSYKITLDARLIQPWGGPSSDQLTLYSNFTAYEEQYYSFEWRQNESNDFQLAERVNGTQTNLGSYGFDFNETQWHTMTFIKNESSLQSFINNILVFSVTNMNALTGGSIGIAASHGIYEIDNITIQDDLSPPVSPPVPDPVPEPSTIFLLGCGVAGIAVFRKKFRS